jgi:hypothetical protein
LVGMYPYIWLPVSKQKITTGQSPLNVSLWTAGRTHTGPSPLDNTTA